MATVRTRQRGNVFISNHFPVVAFADFQVDYQGENVGFSDFDGWSVWKNAVTVSFAYLFSCSKFARQIRIQMTRLSLDFVAILVFSPSNVVVLLTVSRWPMCALLVVTSPAEAEPRWPPAVGLLPVNAATGGRYFERTGGSGRPSTFLLLLLIHLFIYFRRIKTRCGCSCGQ